MSYSKIIMVIFLVICLIFEANNEIIGQKQPAAPIQHANIVREENLLPNSQTISNKILSNKEEPHPEPPNQQQHSTPQDQHQNGNQHHTNIPGVGLSIVFIFGSLLYGALLKLVSRFTSIPYNPLLLLSGIILGMNYDHLGIIGQATQLISNVNPSGILAIFLPCLIFESAFKTQWHTFKKLAAQSLIIGVLSSLVGASLIMVIIKLVIDTNNVYSWHEALLMGSMLTCTDILSFVHKLKRGGTPQKITSLIEGESLFNYCTCVMIFQFMQYYKQSTEQAINQWDYLSLFMEYVLGGIIFGVIAGAIAVYCIKRMIYDGPLVVTLNIIFCYSIYLTAEYSNFRISGIISLTVYSLYMNAFGKTWLFGQTEEYFYSFWNYLVFVAETSIFMIAGVLVGANLTDIHKFHINVSSELLVTIYIYLSVLFSRFVSISVFINYLKKFGEGINWSEVIVLTFAGLKGAIGIALAMNVYHNQNYGQLVSTLIMIHITTNSLLTFTIHGIGTSYIVKFLGVSSLKRVQYKFFQEYLYSFQASILQKKQQLRKQKIDGYEMIEWDEIQKQVGLPRYHEMIQQTQTTLNNREYVQDNKFQKSQMYKLEQILNNYQHIATLTQERSDKFDLEVEYRKRFLKDLISKYWEFHENNFTTPAALMLLIQSANFDLDKETEQIQSWNWIKNEISFNMRVYSQLMKLTLVNELAKSYLFQYVSFCYDVVSSYIKANQQVRDQLQIFYNNNDHKDSDGESNILRNILKESLQNQKQAEFFLINYLQPSFPQIQKQVKTRKVSFFILHTFKKIIDDNNQNGQLQPTEYDLLNNIIDTKSLELNLSSPTWEESKLQTILKDNQLFKMLPEEILDMFQKQIGQVFSFDANERIMDNSQIAKYFYFVKKGGCIVEFTHESMVYKEPMLAGNVFGFESLLTNIYHSKATANTMAQIVQVKKNLMIKIFDAFPKFQQAFWKHHIFQCYKMFVKKDDITSNIGNFHKEQIKQMIDQFKLKKLDPKIMIQKEQDIIFIRGNIEVKDDGERSDKKSDNRHSKNLIMITVSPFTFFSRMQEVMITIKEPSYFLCGQFDYGLLERSSVRLSNKLSKLNKKKTL